jgi:hypothetical protein
VDLAIITGKTTGPSGQLGTIDARVRRIHPIGYGGDNLALEPSILAQITGVIDTSILGAINPPRGGVQQVGLRVYIGGTATPCPPIPDGTRVDDLLESWSVDRNINNPVQTGSLVTSPDQTGFSPFGHPLLGQGPPLGLQNIHIDLAFKLPPSAPYSVNRHAQFPLMRFAMADDFKITDNGPIIYDIPLRDRLARWKDFPVTWFAPAGHGWSYSGIIQYICNHLVNPPNGIPVSIGNAWPGDFQFRKLVQLINGNWLSVCQQLADIWGGHLYCDESGVFSVAILDPERIMSPSATQTTATMNRVQGVINESSIVRSINGRPESITVGVAPEVWTGICLQGTSQVIKPQLGQHTLHLPFSGEAFYAPKSCPSQQSSIGAVTATGLVDVPSTIVISTGYTDIGIDQSTPVSIVSEEKGFINPTAWRYIINSILAITGWNPAFLDGPTANAQAHSSSAERFVTKSRTTQTNEYDSRNFLSRVVKETFGFKQILTFLQSRTDQTKPWTDFVNCPGNAGAKTLGSGDAVIEPEAVYRLTERSIEEYDSTDDGYQSLHRTYVYRYALRPGWQYKYSGALESSDTQEQFILAQTTNEMWSQIDEQTYVHRIQVLDGNGQEVSGKTEVLQGAPPAAQVRTDLAPKRSDYATDFDFAQAVAASQFDQQAMIQLVKAPGLLDFRPVRETPLTDQWCQFPWQLERIGRRLIELGRAVPIEWTMCPNPFVKEGQWWHLQCRRAGDDIDHDVFVMGKKMQQSKPGGSITMRMSAVCFGWITG